MGSYYLLKTVQEEGKLAVCILCAWQGIADLYTHSNPLRVFGFELPRGTEVQTDIK
jgi:hypothetical protein